MQVEYYFVLGIIYDVNIILILIILRSGDTNDLDLSYTLKLLLRLISNEFMNIYFIADDVHILCAKSSIT